MYQRNTPSLNKPEIIMDRSYLLKAIERNFFIFDKDELSQKIANSQGFEERLKSLVERQAGCLNDSKYLSVQHALFYKTIEELLKKMKQNLYAHEEEMLADKSLLAISIYYHYSAVCLPTLMYVFIRNVLKEKILLV